MDARQDLGGIPNSGQPERLIEELHRALVVHEEVDESAVVPGGRVLVVAGQGVPHGVVEARVIMRGLRILKGRIYFCRSYGYIVHEDTIHNGDDGEYPPPSKCRLSLSCKMPPDGEHTAVGLVTVKGEVQLHIESFDVAIPVVSQPARREELAHV